MMLKMVPVSFVLYFGFVHFTFASNRLRLLFSHANSMTLNETRSFCSDENSTLMTVYDEEDLRIALKRTENVTNVWLGLVKNRQPLCTWSDGTDCKYKNVSLPEANGTQQCGAISMGSWKTYDCSMKMHFMCSNGENYTLIHNDSKTWCQAYQYCKKHFNNLVSIKNDHEEKNVLAKGNYTDFWIGLMYDEWQWMDQSCSTFRVWSLLSSNTSHKCTSMFIYEATSLHLYGCDQYARPMCSKGTVRIIVINKMLSWEEAYDYCKANHNGQLWIQDAKDQEAVTQWLNGTGATGQFWIGLRQSRVFGFWIWTSDRTVGYNNWKNGEQPTMPLSNHCGIIDTDLNYMWSDENCWRRLPFLCEEEIVYMTG